MFTRYSVSILLVLASSAIAEEVVVSDDGRQIRLNDDGTWVQVSQDRFATNAQGQRIRLRADGSWNVISASSEDIVRSGSIPNTASLQDEPVIFLKNVEILRREIKRAKSTHAETRMRYTIGVDNKTEQTVALDLTGPFEATTNRGGEYPLLSADGPSQVHPLLSADGPSQVLAGQQAEVVVVVEDSPAWFGVKFLSLEVPAKAIGNAGARLLNKNMNEVKRINVDDF